MEQPTPTPTTTPKRERGSGRIYRRGAIFWIAYSLRGREYRESAKTDDPKKAERFLRSRIKEVGADLIGAKPFLPPQNQRTTVNELLDVLERDYKLREKFNGRVESLLKPLRAHFGEMRAVDVSADHVGRYIESLLTQGYSKASVNRYTQLLGQAYKLGVRQRLIGESPYIQRLSEVGNARQGFFSEPEIRRVMAGLPDYLQDVALFGFLTGWRKGEILSLTWGDVDEDVIRLRAENSKNGEGRVIVLTGELEEIIERRRKLANGLLVFHNDGHAIC